jgi:hypothetical protein
LALEITTTRWPAKDTGGHSPAHSRHKNREPALGSTTDPRRTAQAWHRCRADHGGKIHGEEKAVAIAGLESASSLGGDLKKSMTNIASECRSANIVRDHAMILPDDATPKPDGIFGKDRWRSDVKG